jgi:hypothetical protein
VLVMRDVSITLTESQVARVVREASGGPHLAGLLSGVSDLEVIRMAMQSMWDDHQWSRSVLRSVLVLAACPADGSECEITDIARAIELSPSTTHRYVQTWAALGLIEQNPRTRRYRRALAPGRRPRPGGTRAAG